MNRLSFDFREERLEALGSGALHWPARRVLVVSDLHLGKCARLSAHGGAALPPYDARETLDRLEMDIARAEPTHVVCLGDSFDTAGVRAHLPGEECARIADLVSARAWTWIEGNHDPGASGFGGQTRAELSLGPLTFRHIAQPQPFGEVSGHYHPKARLALRGRMISRPCFLLDAERLILPAYGAYTGGLRTETATLSGLMQPGAHAILCGPKPARIPMPRTPAPARTGT